VRYVHRRQKVSSATRLDSRVGPACTGQLCAADARTGGFPGGYYLLDGGPDELIAISLFDSADEALISNEKAADWVRNNVMEFARGLPEVMVGDVMLGLKQFRNAAITIAGIELMHRIRKGQFGLRRFGVQGRAVPAIWNAVLRA
jgi:hypothetical protein